MFSFSHWNLTFLWYIGFIYLFIFIPMLIWKSVYDRYLLSKTSSCLDGDLNLRPPNLGVAGVTVRAGNWWFVSHLVFLKEFYDPNGFGETVHQSVKFASIEYVRYDMLPKKICSICYVTLSHRSSDFFNDEKR